MSEFPRTWSDRNRRFSALQTIAANAQRRHLHFLYYLPSRGLGVTGLFRENCEQNEGFIPLRNS